MMTQSDYPIYTLDAIHEDICFLVSYFFYDTRKKKEYSLAEVSKKTGISANPECIYAFFDYKPSYLFFN